MSENTGSATSLKAKDKGDKLYLRVYDASNKQIRFKIGQKTALRKLFGAYAKQVGKPLAELTFWHDATQLGPDDTPNDIGLTMNDRLDARLASDLDMGGADGDDTSLSNLDEEQLKKMIEEDDQASDDDDGEEYESEASNGHRAAAAAPPIAALSPAKAKEEKPRRQQREVKRQPYTAEQLSRIIYVNIGGSLFSTQASTLLAGGEGSFWNNVIEADPSILTEDLSEPLFCDRSPTSFRYVLSYLRDIDTFTPESSGMTREQASELLLEARFFQLDDLVDMLEAAIDEDALPSIAHPASRTHDARGVPPFFTTTTIRPLNRVGPSLTVLAQHGFKVINVSVDGKSAHVVLERAAGALTPKSKRDLQAALKGVQPDEL